MPDNKTNKGYMMHGGVSIVIMRSGVAVGCRMGGKPYIIAKHLPIYYIYINGGPNTKFGRQKLDSRQCFCGIGFIRFLISNDGILQYQQMESISY